MKKLLDKIKAVPKGYVAFSDIRKLSGLDENSLKVAVNRMVKDGRLDRIVKGVYTADLARVAWEKFACEYYYPSYLSFEWALAKHGVLSQQPHALTLATERRARRVETPAAVLDYHHLKQDLYWGYGNEGGDLLADPEKAWLDLAYLSLKGYARFDRGEMDLGRLDREKIRRYLKRFDNASLVNFTAGILGK